MTTRNSTTRILRTLKENSLLRFIKFFGGKASKTPSYEVAKMVVRSTVKSCWYIAT